VDADFGKLVTRLVLREGFRDVSFRLGAKGAAREYAIAWSYALLVGGFAYGAAWLSGLAPFVAPAPTSLPVLLALASTVVVPLSALTATGEELGWRGHMVPRLVQAGVPRPLLVGGVIWGLWHAPLILSGQYASGPYPWLSALVFFVSITMDSYVFGRVRLASGSVWPAVLFHSAWNSIIQTGFDSCVPGHDASHAGNIWVGESGILVGAVGVLAAVAFTWRPFAIRLWPGDDSGTTGSIANL
jgi:uncharacterized protein